VTRLHLVISSVTIIIFLAGCASQKKNLNQTELQGDIHSKRGVAAFLKNDHRRAEDEFSLAYSFYASAENERGAARSLLNLIRLYRLSGDMEMAVLFSDKAYRICETHQVMCDETCFEKAKIALLKGDLQEAKRWVNKGATDKTGRSSARLLNLLATIDLRNGALKEAAESSMAALDIAKGDDDALEEANALLLLGECMMSEKNWKAAAEYFNQALLVAKKAGNGKKVHEALLGLADSAAAEGDQKSAEDFRKRGEEVAANMEKIGNRAGSRASPPLSR